MLQEYDRFPQWLIDVEEGKIWSKSRNKYIGNADDKGYLSITDKCNKHLRVHRVIWMCVNGDVPDGYQIHHIDHNTSNNSINNLELVEEHEHKREHKLGTFNNWCSKPVLMIDKNTNEVIAEYPSCSEAGRQTKINSTHIASCCRGDKYRKSIGGFKWKYKYETEL